MKHRKAMFLACARGDADAVQRFASAAPELLSVCEPTKGATPLHFAAIANHVKVVRLLIKLGADINAVTHAGDTALHLAIMKDHNKLAKVLIKHNIDVLARNKHGKTAFQLLKRKRESAAQVAATNSAAAGAGAADATAAAADDAAEGEIEYEYESDSESALRELGELAEVFRAAAERPVRARTSTTPTIAGTVAEHEGASGRESPVPTANEDESYKPFATVTAGDTPPASLVRLRRKLASRCRVFAPRVEPVPDPASKPVVLTVLLADNSTKKIRVADSFTGQNLIDHVCDRFAVADDGRAPKPEDTDTFELVTIDPVTLTIQRFIDADRTVREHAFTATELLMLRTKFFKLPAGDVPAVVLLQLYSQTRSDVLRGELEVSESVAVQLAAWVMHYLYGPFDPRRHNLGFVTASDLVQYLPPKLRRRYTVDVWQARFFASYRTHPPGIAAKDPAALWAYLAVARTLPTFGATLFYAKTTGPGLARPVRIGVCEDGIVVSEGAECWAFYSLYRRAPASSDMELRSWRWDRASATIVFEVVRDGSGTVVTLSYACRGPDAARECAELISGYYILLVFGDSVPSRPMLQLADLPVPAEPLPLRTPMRMPGLRARDSGRQSRLEFLLEDYVAAMAKASVPLIEPVLSAIHEALDFARPLELLSLAGATPTAAQLDGLVTAITHVGAFRGSALDLLERPLVIDLSGCAVGSSAELVAATDRLLSAAGRHLAGVLEVRLVNCALSESALEILALGLGGCKPLNAIDMTGNVLTPGGIKALVGALFKDGHQLLRFGAAACELTNEALNLLASRLLGERSPVQTLVIARNPFTDIENTLVNHLRTTRALRVLDVSDCAGVPPKAASALVDFFEREDTQLRDLTLRRMHLVPRHCDAFAARISANTLVALDLSDNALGKGIKRLGEALTGASAVFRLNLANTGLEKSGIDALAASLPGMLMLKELVLAGNALSSAAGATLITALSSSMALEVLDFSANALKRDFVVALVAALPANRSIRTVNLADNRIGSEGAPELGTAIARCAFSRLDLSGNKLGAGGAGIGPIVEALETNTLLRVLSLANNAIPRAQLDRALRALEVNTSLVTLDVRQNVKFTEAERYAVLEPLQSGCEVLVTVEG